MLKFHLHTVGKIPTAVHPFVKQTVLTQEKQKVFINSGELIRGVQNIASSMYRMVSIPLARLAVGIARLIRNQL